MKDQGASRRIARLLALVLTAAIGVGVVARATGIEAGPLAMIVALMPWVTVLSVFALGFALLARSWWLAAVAGVLALVCVAWQVPLFTGGGEGEATLTVASVNLRFGQAYADAVVAMVRERHVDVLAVSELTPQAVAALGRAGLDEALPYSEALPEADFSGTGLWSRYPLAGEEDLPGFMSHQIRAVVDAPAGELTVYAVHPRAPRSFDHRVWEQELARLHDLLESADGRVLVAGDLNTTRDHAAFRSIESLGYADAADQAGSGFEPTFPVGRGLLPPIVIDHVLERDTRMVALRTMTVTIPKADHRALIAEYGTRP